MSVWPGELRNTAVVRAQLTRGGLRGRPLTSRQTEVLGLVHQYVAHRGEAAPASWVARQLNITHVGVLHHYAALYAKGILRTDGSPAVPRGPELVT